jgi:hypothetical protein
LLLPLVSAVRPEERGQPWRRHRAHLCDLFASCQVGDRGRILDAIKNYLQDLGPERGNLSARIGEGTHPMMIWRTLDPKVLARLLVQATEGRSGIQASGGCPARNSSERGDAAALRRGAGGRPPRETDPTA